MAFIEKKDPVVLNIRLTTKGRELLSTGKLSFKYFAIGDSEIDYEFNAQAGLNPFNANILRPADNNPNLISFIPENLSGDPYNVIPSIPTSTYLVTNNAGSIGFFTNLTGNSFTFIVDGNHVKQPDAMIYTSGVTGGNHLSLKKAPAYGTSGAEPANGDLLLVKWTVNRDTTGYTSQKSYPTPYLIYKIISKIGTLAANNLVVTVDRNVPDFTMMGATAKAGAMILYNYINYSGSTIFNQFSSDYLDESVLTFLQNSQCPTVIFPFWNMSIIFTDEIAGVQLGNKTYREFFTKGYGGFVSYIQSQQPFYKKLGVIHYTNNSPANVYAEGFYLNTAVLDVPTIMWHKSSTPKLGAKFIAASGNGYTLVDLGIHYYNLVDASNSTAIVGKLFDELKMFLIEDQELLYAMSYKSNRSWTLPQFLLGGGSGGCPPAPPAPAVLFVQTRIGQAGSIKNTGGINIIGWESITEYGVEYKLTGATDWTRIKVGTTLTANNFTYTITDATSTVDSSKAYNYRSYIKMGNNEYIDHSNDSYPITIPKLPAPAPPPPPPIIPTVATTTGSAGIGRIINTGGNSIPANVFIAIEKYGIEYKLTSLGDVPQNWYLSPVGLMTGPLSVNNFATTVAGLTEGVSYDYRAYIQVAGLPYRGATQSLVTLSTPAPVLFVPTVTTGIPFKLFPTSVSIRNNYITDKGGTAITEYGVLYTQDPATPVVYGGIGVAKSSIIGDLVDVLVGFSNILSPLMDASPIYWRTFAMNSAGIGYGDTSNDTTPALPTAPTQAQIYICDAQQLATNTMVRSCMCAKLGLTTPLSAGQSIRLCFTDCAYSQANDPLARIVFACSWITTDTHVGATCCNFVSSSLPMGSTSSNANESYSFVDIDMNNINNITLFAVAGSHSTNSTLDYTNTASVHLVEVVNSGGANYAISVPTLSAYNTGGGGGTGGGGIIAAV